jgi:TolA-binding protein
MDELSEETQRKSLEAVAKRLERHNQYSFARDIYKNYIQKNYFNPQVPAYYSLLIESLESDGKISESIQYREKLVNHISKNGKWWNKNTEGEARYNAEEALDKTRLEIARYYADQGIQSGKRGDLLKARKSYRRFIATENSGENTATALFELAQIESKLGMYKNAEKNFSSALNLGLDVEDRPLAAYSQFLSVIESRAYKIPALKPNHLSSKPEKLSVTETLIENSYSQLKREWENTDYEVPAEYFVAQMYLSNVQLKKAEPILSKLLARDNLGANQISYIEDSAKWLVEIYTKSKDWAKVAEVNNRLKNLGAVSSLETSKLAKMRFNNSILSEAELLEEQGKGIEAANAFLNFAVNNPKNYESDRAIFKAAQLLRENGNYKESNKNLAKIFATEYRKDVLRMYTQNLVDSFRFNEATKFVNSLSRKDRRLDPSLMNVVKLKSFLTKEPNIGEKFFSLFTKNNQFPYGAQAFKEFVYSGKLKESALVLARMKKKKTKDMGVQALEALQNWYMGNKSQADKLCNLYVKRYAKKKKVSALQQDLNFQCHSIVSVAESKKSIEELRNEMLSDGAKEAYMFSVAEDANTKPDLLKSLYAEASQQGYAVANLMERKLQEIGAYDFKKYELFPFHIARSESLAWRKLQREDNVFDIENFCNTQGFGRCYKGLLKFSKNSKDKNLDLKLKISLVLDKDKDAIQYANEILENVSANERSKYESIFRRMNLGEFKAEAKEYLEVIFNGEASLNDYLYLAKSFYQQENIRAANFVLSTAAKRFTENPIAQYSVAYLTGKNVDVLAYQVADPRVWFLQHNLGIHKDQNYIAKKRLLGGGEWYYSLGLLKSMQTGKGPRKYRSSESAYYLMLASFTNYKNRNWSIAKDLLQQAKQLGTMPVYQQDNVIERGIASESK